MKTISLIILLLLSVLLSAQTITVKQDGTGDFTTIQAAVDSAQNGDTVLVWPGVYYENIEILSKYVTLGSLTLTTGEDGYIFQTIINGNSNGSCIKTWNWGISDKIIINGFTITNGTGADCGGICGGGLFIEYTNIELDNCLVKKNNCLDYGAGIYLYGSIAYFSNVTITKNHAYNRGGAILLLNYSQLTFDTINRCNIYENYAAVGADIYKLGAPAMEVYVDTFTVQNPDYYYVFSKDSMELPQDDINMHILHHKIEQTFDDLYVSPNGDNNNSGLTPDSALKNISYALLKMASDTVSPDTIHLANGTYSISSGEMFPLSLKSYVTLKGASRDSTILDAEESNRHLNGIPSAKNFNLINFTLQNGNGNIYNEPLRIGSTTLRINFNVKLNNLLFTNNTGDLVGCVKFTRTNNCSLNNVEFLNNFGGKSVRSGAPLMDTLYINNCKFIRNDQGFYSGGGVVTMGTDPFSPISITTIITNTLFAKNLRGDYPGYSTVSILTVDGAKTYLVNCTLADNYSENENGGNIGVVDDAATDIYNSILYNNVPSEIYMFNVASYETNYLSIYHSLVDGGEENIQITTGNNVLYYDTTNIDTDPLFYGGAEFPYNLSDESPCIDAGTLDLPQFILDHMPDTDLAGNPRIFNGKIDMGAYEWNPTVSTKEIPNTKKQIPRLAAAPNPFTTQTIISAKWNKPARVNIEIYNNAGLLIKTLQSGSQPAGSCQIIWDGTDNNSHYLPAGIYIVVLRVEGKEVGSVKVVKR